MWKCNQYKSINKKGWKNLKTSVKAFQSLCCGNKLLNSAKQITLTAEISNKNESFSRNTEFSVLQKLSHNIPFTKLDASDLSKLAN